jgi:arylsulfatase A-like enzyme
MLDQFAAARGQFDPHNAKAVVALMDHFPTVLEGMAEFATAIGRQSVDAVDLPPAAQETFLALGKFQRQAVGPVRDALTAARDTVRDRIARYQEGRSQDEAWDVSKNRD